MVQKAGFETEISANEGDGGNSQGTCRGRGHVEMN